MSFSKYPKYKESNVEWLGSVPEHWRVDRLKQSTLSVRNGIWGDDPQGNADDIACIRVADFDREALRVVFDEPTIRNVTAKERADRTIDFGDLLLEKSGGGELQPVGCVVLYEASRPAVCSNFVARVKLAPDMSASFWRYVHAATYSVRLNTRSIKQTSGIQNLDQQQYFDERAAFPPREEQIAIAVFLDLETAKIDALIAEQRHLMELLKEKRQAVISEAVTKGLNSHASMKNSGIEWLGKVPAHWNVLPMRLVANVVRGASPRPAGDLRYFNGDACPWVTVAEITKDSKVYLVGTETSLTAEGASHSSRFPAGTLIYSNSGATLGVPKILKIEACANDGVVAFLHLKDCVQAEFLYYCLASITDQIRDKVKQGSGQPNLNTDIVKALRFAIPPMSEQRLIVQHISSLMEEFDALSNEAQRAIYLLQERRAALISAAVTGQIDLRKQ